MFSVQPGSDTPIYAQLVQQVEQLVIAGVLKPGDEMPSVRNLARDLTINPMTVSRAFTQLETMGVLIRHKGKGMTVGTTDRLATETLAPTVQSLVREAKRLGLSEHQTHELISEEWKSND